MIKKPIQQQYLLICLLAGMFISCSENDNDFVKAATVKVVNLMSGEDSDSLLVKLGSNPINYATTKAVVTFEQPENFSIAQNVTTQLEIVSLSDTLTSIFSESLNLEGIHSLFFIGDRDASNTLLIEDKPKQFTDSLVGVRFVNLSQLAGSITINVAGGESIVTGLDQNSATDFIEFPAKVQDESYVFESRNATGELLSSFTLNPTESNNVSVKKNLTLVIHDKIAFASLIQGFSRVNSY
ncbi:hypothetical protein [Flavivirga eckloniae]|nr:hypothetical protein [Flavivirga eckloniae]